MAATAQAYKTPGGAGAAMARRIDADLDALVELVVAHGSVGAAALPDDAFAEVVETLHVYYDGNDRRAALATEDFWFWIHMTTS